MIAVAITQFLTRSPLVFLLAAQLTAGFTPPGHTQRCSTRSTHQARWVKVPLSQSGVQVRHTHRIPTWTLHGVDDYFASLSSGDEGDDDDDGASSPNESKKGKYIGHGRIGGDEGGLFNTNNYFASLGDVGDADAAPPQSIEESRDQPTQQEQQNERPVIRMTYEEMVAYNDARLCPKLLLTQVAIQSFISLLEECRDPHSGKWIEDFLGLPNLRNYHGTGAFNVTQYPTWDSVLYDIMRQPNNKMIVSAKRRGRGQGGWSKNNPYLQERWVEFKIDIRPATLVQRLLSVREQLANEFERDLEIVGMVDERIMDSYFNNLRDGQEQSSSFTSFDRLTAEILTNFTEFQESDSSPLRRGNFDLLYSLCTQASAHRLLRDLRSTSEEDITYQWFKRFYSERVPEFFDGDQKFGRGDDFMDALLNAPPSLVEMSGGKEVGLTDPLRIAERIISLRSEIAQEWKGTMGEVKGDHLEMNDVLFRVMTGRTIDESGNEVVEIQEELTTADLSDSTGAFE